MTTSTDDSRLGILEGRITEQSAFLQQLSDRLDTGLREVNARLDAGLQEVNARLDAGLAGVNSRLDAGLAGVNSRIDRLFLAMLGIGAAQIALLVTMIIRGN